MTGSDPSAETTDPGMTLGSRASAPRSDVGIKTCRIRPLIYIPPFYPAIRPSKPLEGFFKALQSNNTTYAKEKLNKTQPRTTLYCHKTSRCYGMNLLRRFVLTNDQILLKMGIIWFPLGNASILRTTTEKAHPGIITY